MKSYNQQDLIFSKIMASAMGIFLLLACIGNTYAQAAETPKIGFVNIPKLMDKSPQAIAAQRRLRSEFSDTRDELAECSKSLSLLDKKLRNEGKTMAEEKRERMIETITRKRRECEEIQNEIQGKFNKKRSEELRSLQDLISGIIEDIAKEKQFDLIVGPPVLYVAPQVDLTEQVLKKLNQ